MVAKYGEGCAHCVVGLQAAHKQKVLHVTRSQGLPIPTALAGRWRQCQKLVVLFSYCCISFPGGKNLPRPPPQNPADSKDNHRVLHAFNQPLTLPAKSNFLASPSLWYNYTQSSSRVTSEPVSGLLQSKEMSTCIGRACPLQPYGQVREG